jgi:hypothetical protein
MSTNPLIAVLSRSALIGQGRIPQPSLSAQRSFSDWFQPPLPSVESALQQEFEQESEFQRHQRQQAIVQALQQPGDLYSDPLRLIRRGEGIRLTWQLINGPLAGLLIQAELTNGQLRISLTVSDWTHYHCLLEQKKRWLKILRSGHDAVSVEVRYVVSVT